MLVYPSAIDLSSRTLQRLAGLLAGHRRQIGSRWRRLTCGRQALLVLAHLRCGDTYARLAAGSASESRRSTATSARPSTS
ncbi:hypothetical protein GCM10010238_59040 [Streptomyces griseoviridis]|uniref:Transposase Helix-turn-helix domain-containing protein n=1 Tax=Streptomyces griseoviridis TaxID=45398 RepID=A0A918GVD2_STRGD|nr:hypothetical protein GCM10010238_59040 [Streptomyces niveoruber]